MKKNKRQRPQINITFDESFKKVDLRGAASGADMNTESRSQMSSPTCYQTADSAETQASSSGSEKVKRSAKVSLMISRWEEAVGGRLEDDNLLSPGDQADSSSRLSCGSTSSSDTSSANNHDLTVTSDPSISGDQETPEQKRERKLKKKCWRAEKTILVHRV